MASFVVLIPIWAPSSSTSLTLGARIPSLILACWMTGRAGSGARRLGLKKLSPSRAYPPLSTTKTAASSGRFLVVTTRLNLR